MKMDSATTRRWLAHKHAIAAGAAALVLAGSMAVWAVGKNDKKATFIPRSAVGLVYYSDDISGFSLAKPK